MDDAELKAMLEAVIVSQVLILGRLIKAEKAANGVRTSSDCTSDAASLIRQNSSRILQLLR